MRQVLRTVWLWSKEKKWRCVYEYLTFITIAYSCTERRERKQLKTRWKLGLGLVKIVKMTYLEMWYWCCTGVQIRINIIPTVSNSTDSCFSFSQLFSWFFLIPFLQHMIPLREQWTVQIRNYNMAKIYWQHNL